MSNNSDSVLLVSMPFAEIAIPSIQLAILEKYCKERGIAISSKHLYLKAAEIYGLNSYNLLLNNFGGPYAAQMFFSRFVFLDHWERSKDRIRDYYDKITKKNQKFNYDFFIQKTEEFYNLILTNINWDDFDIIGFTLNYGQLIPSLAIAKKIKEKYPNKKIVLGGSRTSGEIGKKILEVFDFIDFIVSGDGEEVLYQLAIKNKNLSNLIFRNIKGVACKNQDTYLDLNDLPILDFDSFYNDLSSTSTEIKNYYHVYGRLPIEISRGCWWNKCTFCNLNIQYKNYREKKIDKILEEIKYLSNKYKMLTFQIIGNTLPLNNYRSLFEEIRKLEKDYTFIVETRAGRLKSDDYRLLKEAGFIKIQTGIESFSASYLKKMNKGVRVIDNIAALKFCKENGITNNYNIVIGYPNEEEIDFKETEKNIQLLKKYLDPPNIAYLEIGKESYIYKNPEKYAIDHLHFINIDEIMFPPEILNKDISFFYTYNKNKYKENDKWKKLIEEWKEIHNNNSSDTNDRLTIVDKLLFYYVDGGDFIKIYDKKNSKNVIVYILDQIEREIFLSCHDVISFQKLTEIFSNIPEYQLVAILHTFEKNGIVYHENNYYLSLPLDYRKCFGIDKKTNIESCDDMITEKIAV